MYGKATHMEILSWPEDEENTHEIGAKAIIHH